MKLRTKIIIASAAVVIAIAIVLTQIVFPLGFTNDKIEYRRLTEVERSYFEYGFKFYVSYNVQIFGSGRQTFSLSADDITTYDVDEEYFKQP